MVRVQIYVPKGQLQWNRINGDIPIQLSIRVVAFGDFWGIEREHPELLKQSEFDEKKGISCILVNTQKAAELCEKLSDRMYLYESSFMKIAKKNGQLDHPSTESERRNTVMEIYEKSGDDGVEKWFRKKYKKCICFRLAFSVLVYAHI